jgi:hypothetical protein
MKKINILSPLAVMATFLAITCNPESKLGGETARMDKSVACIFPTYPPRSNEDGVACIFPTYPPHSNADGVVC